MADTPASPDILAIVAKVLTPVLVFFSGLLGYFFKKELKRIDDSLEKLTNQIKALDDPINENENEIIEIKAKFEGYQNMTAQQFKDVKHQLDRIENLLRDK